jgi:4a-hydroxytetrahydrobiopterin dehydratase
MMNPEWKESNKLVREFKFDNFAKALEFANKVGELAERADHHPDMEISWGKVVIKLWTHSEGAITDKDYALAEKIDKL